MMAGIDGTKYGLSLNLEREVRALFASIAYKAKSGLGLGVGVAGALLVPFIGLTAGYHSSGKLLCGTTVRSFTIDLSAFLFHLSLVFTVATGKRNDALVERIIAARDAMRVEEWKPTSYQYGGEVVVEEDPGAGIVSDKR